MKHSKFSFFFWFFFSFFCIFLMFFSWFFNEKHKKHETMLFSCLYFIWKINLVHHKILASIGSPGGTTLKVYRRARSLYYEVTKIKIAKKLSISFQRLQFFPGVLTCSTIWCRNQVSKKDIKMRNSASKLSKWEKKWWKMMKNENFWKITKINSQHQETDFYSFKIEKDL